MGRGADGADTVVVHSSPRTCILWNGKKPDRASCHTCKGNGLTAGPTAVHWGAAADVNLETAIVLSWR